MRICIVGDSQDLTSVYIGWLAKRRGIQVIELSEETLGTDWAFEVCEAERRQGRLRIGGEVYRLDELHGAFVRFRPEPALPTDLDLGPAERAAFIAERRAGIQYFLNCLPCVVANPPSSGRSNGSKPYQMRLLANAGFEVPKWVVTSEESVVREFARTCRHGAIYKSCSGLRSKVRPLDREVFQRLRDGTTPVVVQEYIKGKDVRVHVVRRRCLATEVISNGIDYRFETEGNEFRSTSAPDPIEELCSTVAEAEGLTIAGFDFRVTADGRWYCLEVNPVPTFLPYEMATGQPIADALLDTCVQR